MTKRIALFRSRLFDLISVASLILCLAILSARVRGVSGISCWARAGGNLYRVGQQGGDVIVSGLGPWPCGELRWNSNLSFVENPDDFDAENPWQTVSAHHYLLGVETLPCNGSVAVDPDGRVPWTVGGRGAFSAQFSVPVRGWSVAVPSWLLLALLSPLPAVWIGALFARWRQHRRRRLNDRSHCHVCRYNLIGNVSGVCPECGTPTAAVGQVSWMGGRPDQ